MAMDTAKAAKAIDVATAGDGKLYFRVADFGTYAGKYEDGQPNFYKTNLKVNKVYCFANGDWQNAVTLAAETVVNGQGLFSFNVADLGGMVPDTIAINMTGEWWNDGVTATKFIVTPISTTEPAPIEMGGEEETTTAPVEEETTTAPVEEETTTAPANEYEKFYGTGDYNMDGERSIADARALLVDIANLAEVNDDLLKICDMNADGKISIADARALLVLIANGEVAY